MKLTKKVFAGLLAVAMLLTSGVGVFAASSKTVVQSADSAYVVNKDGDSILTTSKFEELKNDEPEVATMIEKATKGEITATELANEMEAWLKDAEISDEAEALTEQAIKEIKEEKLDFITPFYEMEPVGEVQQNENGMYVVKLSISSLTENMKNIRILHFSTVRKCYELITPTNVDYANKIVTFEVKDFSPIAILADNAANTQAPSNGTASNGTASNGTASSGTSPKTEGMNSSWMMLMGAAFVMLMAGSAMVCRKKNCQ